jgi:hypothetical protein
MLFRDFSDFSLLFFATPFVFISLEQPMRLCQCIFFLGHLLFRWKLSCLRDKFADKKGKVLLQGKES